MDYAEFLQKKQDHGADSGFDPVWMPDFLFDFQKHLVEWAVRKGRAAIFADCGMGKTPIQLVWAQNVLQKTAKPVMVLTPLSVSFQTLQEAEKFGIWAKRANPGANPNMIQVTNYEQLHKFSPYDYSGVVCDESSILKNFDGTLKAQITEFMRVVPYRLLCTATAAPNDWTELGTSSEALGYYGYTDMLSKFFTNKAKTIKARHGRFARGADKYVLREHATEKFWRWMASWSRAARSPSDLGFDNDGFILPELIENNVTVDGEKDPNKLFDMRAVNWHDERAAIRRTIDDRCEAVAKRVDDHNGVSVVWCHLNDEGDLLEELIPDSMQVAGRDSDEKKEEILKWFINSEKTHRTLISKPNILGFGMNFQFADHTTYFPTHSYEQYYQATRRLWRFGQESPVIVDRIYTRGTERMLENMVRKSRLADEMFTEMVRYMGAGLNVKNTYEYLEMEVPQWLGK